jgi:hypothetical protein
MCSLTMDGISLPAPPIAPAMHQPSTGAPSGASAPVTHEQSIAAWIDLVEATDQILLAALRTRHATEAEVEAAYRACHQRQIEEHDRGVREMLIQFDRRWCQHGR